MTIQLKPTINYYAFVSGSWTDITAYQLGEYSVTGSRGMQDGRWTTRIARTGELKFTLQNSTGQFTPGSAGALTGFGKGTKIKLVVTFDGASYVRFYGAVDDISYNDGGVNNHTATVTVLDWMSYIYNYPLSTMATQALKTGDAGIQSIHAGVVQVPQATSIDTGTITFDALFDTTTTNTTAATEINKIVQSEGGYYYERADAAYGETIVFENAYRRTGLSILKRIPLSTDLCSMLTDESGNYITDESGNQIVVDAAEDAIFDNKGFAFDRSYGDNLVNRVKVTAYPKSVGTSNVTLFTLDSPLYVGAMQSVTIKGKYTNPTGGASVNAVSTTCSSTYAMNTISGGGGTDLTSSFGVVATYGTEAPVFVFTNNSAYGGYVNSVVTVGHMVTQSNAVEAVVEDTTSQATYGISNLSPSIEQQYSRTIVQGSALAAKIIEFEKNPRVELNNITYCANSDYTMMMAFLNVDVGDMVRVTEDDLGIDAYYYVQGISFTIAKGSVIMYKLTLKRSWSLNKGLSLIALQGHSASTDCISFGNLPQLIDLPIMSLSAWIYPTAYNTNVRTDVMAGWVSGVGGFQIYISTLAGTYGKVVFIRAYTTSGGKWKQTTENIPLNTWAHIVVTKDSTTSAPVMYVNGVSVAVTEVIPAVGTPGSVNGMDFSLGNTHGSGADVQYAWPFIGKLKDCRVYNRIITPSEAASMYSLGAGDMTITDGLVFQGPTVRTDYLSYFTNHTMLSNDRLIDNIYGAVGTPNGSPTTVLP